jgi:hypothetical protein
MAASAGDADIDVRHQQQLISRNRAAAAMAASAGDADIDVRHQQQLRRNAGCR